MNPGELREVLDVRVGGDCAGLRRASHGCGIGVSSLVVGCSISAARE